MQKALASTCKPVRAGLLQGACLLLLPVKSKHVLFLFLFPFLPMMCLQTVEGSASCFCKQSNSQCFRFRGPCCFCCSSPTVPFWPQSSHSLYIDKRAHLRFSIALFTEPRRRQDLPPQTEISKGNDLSLSHARGCRRTPENTAVPHYGVTHRSNVSSET